MSARAPGGGIAPGGLVYRVGGYDSFLREMSRALAAQTLPDGEYAGTRPLQRLRADGGENWVAGLLRAWASVGEVLAFYQERIANEGFVPSAVEALSLRELARLIGYQPFPGVGAEGYVAFTLGDAGPAAVRLERGARLASVPGDGRDAQAWETLAPTELRRAWNALRPRVAATRLEASLDGSSRCVLVQARAEGVRAGARIAILAGTGEAQEGLVRVVERVEPVPALDTGGDLLRLHWAEPLDARAASKRYAPVEVRVLGDRIELFGHDAPDWGAVPEGVKAEFGIPEGGVIRWSESGWQRAGDGLDETTVTSLLGRADGSLLAGTPNGVFCARPGERWERAGSTLIGVRVECLAAADARTAFAGSAAQGVFRCIDGVDWEPLHGETPLQPAVQMWRGRFRSGRLPSAPVRALLADGRTLFAGTDHGVFRYQAGPSTWQPASRGLPGWSARSGHAAAVVYALARCRAGGPLVAGTDQGVFVGAAAGRRWERRCEGLPHDEDDPGRCAVTVFHLLQVDDEELDVAYLLAATDAGVFRAVAASGAWRAASLGLPDTDLESGHSGTEVRVLAATTSPRSGVRRVVAATTQGVFFSDDIGDYWQRLDGGDLDADPPPPAARPAGALTIDDHGRPVAHVRPGGFAHPQRPQYARASLGEGLDLAVATPQARAGMWAALIAPDAVTPDAAPADALVFRVRTAASAMRASYRGRQRVTRLTADRELSSWLERHPQAGLHLAPAAALPMPQGDFARVEPMAQGRIVLRDEDAGSAFAGAREVFVIGRRMRVRVPAGQPLTWDDGTRQPLARRSEFVVTALGAGAGTPRLALRAEHGREATLEADRDVLEWVPAARGDERVAERVRGLWLARASAHEAAQLAFVPTLRNAFDPTTVVVQANVARASQGSRIRVDRLGSGDATRAHQSFPFAAQPVTFLRAPGARGCRSTVEIRVSGVPWTEIESLLDAGPDDQVYTLRQDSDGRTVVQFGDGTNGARLPTGQDNVVASYRTGMWADALPANALRVLRTRPAGVRSVTNPLPIAAPGAAEDPARLRRRLPGVTRTLGRIVSRADFEDFCRAYTAIDRVCSTELSDSGGPLLHLTIATTDGDAVAPGDPFHQELLTAIRAASGGGARILVQSAHRVRLRLEASLRPRAGEREEEILAAARELVRERYGYHRAEFAGQVVPAHVVRALGALPGVAGCTLEVLCRRDEPADASGAVSRVLARPARWDAHAARAVPAELLEIVPEAGLVLRVGEGASDAP